MSRHDLSVTICGVLLKNPFVLASGILGTGAALLARVARAGAGAVTAKSYGPEPRAGHPNPTVLDWGGGLINAVGLPNPGVEVGVRELLETKERLRPLGVPLIASLFADTAKGYGEVARAIAQAGPDLLEINISCPNVEDEFGQPFAADPRAAAQVTLEVKRATKLPAIVKLSPNVADIKAIARAVEQAGADAISAINTLGPGMVIDIEAGRPILAHRVGGISGPAIRPIAVRCVYDICSAVSIPVIGIGGVLRGRDAVEMIMAGASAVGIGSAVYYHGLGVFKRLEAELSTYMEAHGYARLEDFRGVAHEG
ncbi:MAG: dihydroorotate dehydrogenase [Chloroflexota bacterium]